METPQGTVAKTVAAPPGPLPLRQDEVVGAALILKAALFTVVLLAVTYVVLRLYLRLKVGDAMASAPPLRCVASLRLSGKTHVHLVVVAGRNVLVTEGSTGAQSLVLGDAGDSRPRIET